MGSLLLKKKLQPQGLNSGRLERSHMTKNSQHPPAPCCTLLQVEINAIQRPPFPSLPRRPNRASAFANAWFGHRVGSKGKGGHYIALISLCNKAQHGAAGYCKFLAMWLLPSGPEFNPQGCNFFFNSKDPITRSTDVKLSSVQHHSVSLSAYIHFSDSALSTLISAEHSDQCWTDLSGPLLSPFPANLAGERGKLTLIRTCGEE